MISDTIIIGLLIFIIWHGARYLPTIAKNQKIIIDNQIIIAKNLNEMERKFLLQIKELSK